MPEKQLPSIEDIKVTDKRSSAEALQPPRPEQSRPPHLDKQDTYDVFDLAAGEVAVEGHKLSEQQQQEVMDKVDDALRTSGLFDQVEAGSAPTQEAIDRLAQMMDAAGEGQAPAQQELQQRYRDYMVAASRGPEALADMRNDVAASERSHEERSNGQELQSDEITQYLTAREEQNNTSEASPKDKAAEATGILAARDVLQQAERAGLTPLEAVQQRLEDNRARLETTNHAGRKERMEDENTFLTGLAHRLNSPSGTRLELREHAANKNRAEQDKTVDLMREKIAGMNVSSGKSRAEQAPAEEDPAVKAGREALEGLNLSSGRQAPERPRTEQQDKQVEQARQMLEGLNVSSGDRLNRQPAADRLEIPDVDAEKRDRSQQGARRRIENAQSMLNSVSEPRATRLEDAPGAESDEAKRTREKARDIEKWALTHQEFRALHAQENAMVEDAQKYQLSSDTKKQLSERSDRGNFNTTNPDDLESLLNTLKLPPDHVADTMQQAREAYAKEKDPRFFLTFNRLPNGQLDYGMLGVFSNGLK
jgi:hypothetical protein